MLPPELKLEDLPSIDNIADHISDKDLTAIGQSVGDWVKEDLASRKGWEKRHEGALKLASQVVEAKNSPWPGAANIKFPMLTLAALQFHARAYPALVPYKNIVTSRTIGEDPDGAKAERGFRVASYVSTSLLMRWMTGRRIKTGFL